MRVLLAAPPHRDTFGYSMPPPGLLRLGGELERRGIAVELEDLAYRLGAGELSGGDDLADAAAERLLARGPRDVIGLSVMGATLPIALAILERIRPRAPRAKLLLGGPGTTGVDRALVERFACVDAVVRGEGEITLPELLARIGRGEDAEGVPGVTWRDGAGRARREADREPMLDLATLPPCAFGLLPSIAEYKAITGAEDGLVPIDSGRGCVFDCSFCTIGRFWSRRSRPLPAARLADEVCALRRMPAARTAYLCHDIFGADRRHAALFCREMIARGTPVPWEARARADHLDRELLDLMARAGCFRVLIGVESADPDVRERCGKAMRRDIDLLRLVDDCAAAGITPILSLILGLPGEDEAALRRSLDFCAQASLRAGVNISLHLVNPQPGCALGQEHGARAKPIEGIPPDMAWGAGETAPEREIRAAHPDLFTTWALLPDDEAHLRGLHAIASELPEVLMRYPRTFALLGKRLGAGSLDLYRAWKAGGRSIEGFARERGDPLVDETLAWEQAIARAAARRSGAEVLFFEHDLSGSGERRPTWLAVAPSARGVRTVRISRDVARLVEAVRAGASVEDLEARRPGIRAVLQEVMA